MKKIPVAGPWITQKEIDYVADAAARAWYENANIYHEKFEKIFCKYLNVKYAIALPSCTSAIHLALLSLNIGAGDEVIVPDITWIASSAPISYIGASPVFADVDHDDWCLSSESFKECITSHTKAVIVVDLYGNMPKWDRIIEIANHYGIPIIEDAAEALGSSYYGKKAGTLGKVGVFSFHGSKTITTGEGGMLVTNDKEIYERALLLRDHGRIPGEKMFWNGEIAYKYKMSSLQAALGLAQMERVDELVGRKREIFSWYKELLKDCEGMTLNIEPEGVINSYWMVTAIVDKKYGIPKETIMAKLRNHGIDTRPFFYPLSSQPAYQHLFESQRAKERNKTSYEISPYGINLPCALNLTKEQVGYVCEVLSSIITR